MRRDPKGAGGRKVEEGEGAKHETYDDRPAVRANGTVRPSAKPMIMSRIMSPWALCFSLWRFSLLL